MAALRFQIHVDKENTGAIGANPKLRNGNPSGIRGKVFQDSGTPGFIKARKALGDVNTPASGRPRKALGDVNTPASGRPRKALGDVNGTFEPVLKGKSGGLKPMSLTTQNFKKPEAKKQQEKSVKKQEPKVVAPTVFTTSSVPSVIECEEIEKMGYRDPEDDDEDVWPAKDRISTYIDKLISWRPPCLFGPGSASDDEIEEEEREIRTIMGQLDALPQPELVIEEEPLPPAESLLVTLPEEDVPFADITLDSIQDVTPPSLDDSYNVVMSNLGTLALKEDVDI